MEDTEEYWKTLRSIGRHDDKYVTVSIVMSQVISGHMARGIGEPIWKRYAGVPPVPIVPYSCDPLQGSAPPSLSKSPLDDNNDNNCENVTIMMTIH